MKAAKGKEAAKNSREALKPVDDRLVGFWGYSIVYGLGDPYGSSYCFKL